LADKKITQLTNITGANLAEADEFVVVDITADETKAITFSELKTAFDTGTGFVRITGDTMTGDLSFGDNDKAIFGAGSDLQIYHDGTHSYISDQGTGNLRIAASDRIQFYNDATDEVLAQFNSGAESQLRYAGATKLATTSTGIAVTGSTAHTAGDITNTISGTYNLNGANGTAGSATYVTYSFKDDPNTGMYRAAADTLTFATGGTERMRLDSSGSVLFGGITDKNVFNDTSGTGASINNNAGEMQIKNASDTCLYLNRTGSDGTIFSLRKNGSTIGTIGVSSSAKMSIIGTNNNLQIGAAGSNVFNVSTASVYPDTDNSVDLGLSNRRFQDVYGVNFHGDGSNLTGVGGSTTAGAVGTYAWAAFGTNQEDLDFGETKAGSNLYPVAVGYDGHTGNSTATALGGHNGALSGTWRCMGDASNPPYNRMGGTLWVRVS